MRPSEDGVESNGKQTAGPYERNSIRPLTMASLLGAGEAGTERTEARVMPEGIIRPSPSWNKGVETEGSRGTRKTLNAVRACESDSGMVRGGWRQNGRKCRSSEPGIPSGSRRSMSARESEPAYELRNAVMGAEQRRVGRWMRERQTRPEATASQCFRTS